MISCWNGLTSNIKSFILLSFQLPPSDASPVRAVRENPPSAELQLGVGGLIGRREERRTDSQNGLGVWRTAQTEVKEQPDPTRWGNVWHRVSLPEKPPQVSHSLEPPHHRRQACTNARAALRWAASWGLKRRWPSAPAVGTHSPRWEILQRSGASQRDSYNDAYFPEDFAGLNR